MNQAQLVDALAEKCGQQKTVIEEFLAALSVEAIASLRRGGEVVLPHLGKLKPVERAARAGRNPKTGEAVKIPAKTVAKFSAAKDLRDALQKPKKK